MGRWNDRRHGGRDDDDRRHDDDRDRNDVLFGGNQADTLTGLGGNDKLFGGDGDDVLEGGDGNDRLYGGDGDDLIDGGDGNDTIEAGAGNDTVRGGNRNDRIQADEGDDNVEAGAGNDTVYGGDGNDSIDGGDGNDWISGGAGDDLISGGGGYDRIYAGDGDDVANGGGNNDTIYGGAGGDTLSGGGDNDVLVGDEGNDSISGDVGRDRIYGGEGNDTVDGGDGLDTIYGGDGADVISAGDDNDYVAGGDGDDAIDLGAGRDRVYGENGNDAISGGDDRDTMFGGDGDDTMSGDGDDDRVFGGDGNDVLTDDDGDNYAYGGDGDDRIETGAGDDVLHGNDDNDTISSGDGDDWIFGGKGNDELDAGAGNDRIYAGHGDDTLTGGAGNDTLIGSKGADVINGEGFDSADLPAQLLRSADGTYDVTGLDQVVISVQNLGGRAGFDNTFGFYLADADGNPVSGEIIFEDVSKCRHDELRTIELDADDLNGAAAIGFFLIPDGDDHNRRLDDGDPVSFQQDRNGNWQAVSGGRVLDSAFGKDTVFFSNAALNPDGVDHEVDNGLPGNSAWEDLLGGGDNDFDDATFQIDLFDGPQPDFSDYIRAGKGDDIVNGNLGDDDIDGDSGDDIITGGAGDDEIDGGSGTDTAIFSGSILDYTISRGRGDRIIVSGPDGTDELRRVEILVFDDFVLNIDNDTEIITGGDGDDSLTGSDSDDAIFGGGGDDTISAGAGNDLVDGDDGDDVIDAGDGNDAVSGGAGDDSISGGAGEDSLFGGDGDDTVDGGSGDDTILGGAGDDLIFGGEGDDFIDAGAGNDTVFGGGGNDTTVGGEGDDSVEAGEGNDSVSGGAGNDTVSGGDGSDAIDGGEGDDSLSGDAGADTLTGGLGDDVLDGGADDDSLDGGEGDDTILGGAGNDTVDAGAGSDSIDGGEGDDTVSGGAGNDTVLGGDGNDTVLGGDGDDLLQGGPGDDSLDGGLGNDTLLGDGGNDTLLGGEGDDSAEGGAGDDVVDGGLGNDTVAGGDGNDALDGGDGNDSLSGDAGADTLTGGLGDDVLDGGADDDSLDGGEGDDTVLGGEGNDTVDAGAGNDSVNGGEGDDSIVAGSGDDTVLGGDGNDTVLGGEGNDLLQGGPGDDVLDGGIGNDTILGDAGNDTLIGGEGNDSVEAGAGDDSLSGGAGDDTVLGGDGNDTVDAGAGNDSVDGGEGDDSVSAGAGDDTVLGGDGNDAILGGDGDDLLQGGPGDDSLDGGLGNDTVLGDAGNDSLLGGEGNDIIAGGDGDDLVDGGLDNDSIRGDAGADTLLGDAGDDTLDGGADNDSLNGGAGSDVIDGGDGDDTVVAGDGSDVVDGGDGNDLIFGGPGEDAINAGAGNDTVFGGADDDTLLGGDGNDEITGDGGDDVIDGGDGDDTVFFSGNHDEYDVTFNPDGSVTITDTVPGRDGTTTLTNVETASFADADYNADGTNNAPEAFDDVAATDEDTAVNIDVLANDFDFDSDELSVASATADNGSVTIEADGTITYTGNQDFNGADTITYTVDDGRGGQDTAEVTVTVNAVNDAPVITVPTGGAMRFDGNAANHVQVAHAADLSPDSWTVEAWVTTSDADGQFNRVVTKPVGGGQTYSLVVRGGEAHIRFDDATLGQQFVQAGFVADGEPHHIAGVYDDVANTLSLYVDGVLTGSISTAGRTPVQGTEELNIGRFNDGFGQGFTGDVSEVRVWSVARSAAEIAGNFDQVMDSSNEPDLELYMTFDRTFAEPGKVQDLSGHDFDGQIFGSPQFVAGSAPVDQFIQTEVGQEVRFFGGAVSDVDAAEGTNEVQVVIEAQNGIIDTSNGVGFTHIGDRTSQVTLIGDPALLSLSMDNMTFRPDPGFIGEETITITVTDLGNSGAGGPQIAVATFTILVVEPNVAPEAVDDAATTDEDTAVNIDVLANDVDDNGDDLTVTEAAAANGAVVIEADNTLTYTPDADFNGTDTISYTITDGNGEFSTAEVTVTVNAVNDAPVIFALGSDVEGNVVEDSADPLTDSGSIAFIDFDSGDSHTVTTAFTGSAGNPGAITPAQAQAFFSAAINGSAADWSFSADNALFDHLACDETLTFTYQLVIDDGAGGSATEFVNVTVEGTNDLPRVAAPVDGGATDEDSGPVSIDLLANASDAEGDDLATTGVSVTSSNAARTVAFTVDDATGELIIDPAQFNDLPSGAAETITIDYGVIEQDRLAADSIGTQVSPNNGAYYVFDFDTGALTFELNVPGGGLSFPGPSSIPQNGVIITLNPNNANVHVGVRTYEGGVETRRDASEQSIDAYSGTTGPLGDSGPNFFGPGVVYNDSMVNSAITWSGTLDDGCGPREVEVVLSGLNYTDNAGGILSIGNASAAAVPPATPATATLVIEGINDRPVVTGPVDAGSVTEDDAPVTIDLLANSSDPDNDDLDVEDVAVSSTNAARNVAVTVDEETGELVIDPAQFNDLAAGESETVTVSYNVSDTTADFSGAIGSPGVPNGGVTYVVDFDTGNIFTFVRSSGPFLPANLQPENGAYLHLNPNNGFSGVLAAATYRDGVETIRDASEFDFGDYAGSVSGAGFVGALSGDTLTWTAHDVATADGERCVSIRLDNVTHFRTDGINVGSANFDVTADVAAEATITITGLNDAPDAVDDAVTTDEDTAVNIAVLANDTDPDASDDLTVTSATASNGQVVIEADNTLTYTPDADFNGSDTISYTISDGNGGTDTADVAVTVNAVNDAPVLTVPELVNATSTNFDTVLVGGINNTNDASTLAVTALANGTYVTADDSGFNVGRLAIVDGDGNVLSNFSVSADPTHTNDVSHSVAGLDGGRFAASWVNNRADLFMRVFEADGTPVTGNIQVDDNGRSFIDGNAKLAATADGGFVSVYSGFAGTQDLFARRFDENGNETQATFALQVQLGDARTPDVVGTSDNGFALAYQFFSAGVAEIRLAIVEADGSFTAQDVVVGSGIGSRGIGIAELAGGGFAIAWDDANDAGTLRQSFVQLVDASGNLTGGPILVADWTSNGFDGQFEADIEALPDGGFAVVFSNKRFAQTDNETGEVRDAGSWVQRFNADGTPNGEEIFVASMFKPELALSPSGDLVVIGLNFTLGGNRPQLVELGLPQDPGATSEDTPLTIDGLSISDIDVAEGTGEVEAVLSVTNGTIDVTNTGAAIAGDGTGSVTVTGALADVNAAIGSVVYTPDANFNGTDSLDITVSDLGNTGAGGPLTDSESVQITVSAVNDAPVAADDAFATGESGFISVDLLANDSDLDGDALSVQDVNGEAPLTAFTVTSAGGRSGQAIFDTTGALNFAFDTAGGFEGLAENETDTVTLTYTVSDGNGGTDTASITVTINGENDAPVAADDTATVDEDSSVIIDILSNDSDVDGDTLTVTSATANNGTVVIEANGTLTYTPDADFNGSDTISCTVDDGNGGVTTAEVAVTVNAVNDAPVLSAPVAGAVRFDGNTANHVEIAHDDGLNSASWTVETWITTTDDDSPFNRILTKPVGGGQTYSLVVNNGEAHIRFDDATLGEQFVQAGFVADGQPHHIAGVFDDAANTLSLYVDGVLTGSITTTGTPLLGNEDIQIGQFSNSFASFGFDGDISDVRIWSEARTAADIAADLNGVPDPVAEDGLEVYMVFSRMFTGFDEGSVQGANTIQDLSGNDRDGQIFGFLQFVAGDAPVDSAIVTEIGQEVRFLDLSVLDVDAAEGTNQIQVVLETTDGIIDTQTFPGFTQIGDRTGQVTLIGDPATLSDSLDFSTFKPNPGFSGTATVTVTATDLGNTGAGGPQTTVMTFNIEVIDPNAAPVAVNDTATTDEDTAVNIEVLTNDSDPDAPDTLTVTEATAGNGTVVIEPDGSLTYTPDADFNGSDTISYTISDGSLTDTAEVAVTVNAVNDAPVIDAGASDLSSDLTVGFTRAASLDANDLLANFVNPSRSAVVIDEGALDVLHVGTGGVSRTTLIEIPLFSVGELTADANVTVIFDGVVQRTSGDQDLAFGLRDPDQAIAFFTADGSTGLIFADEMIGAGPFGVGLTNLPPSVARAAVSGPQIQDFTVRVDLAGASDELTLVEGGGITFNASTGPGTFIDTEDGVSIFIGGDGNNESYEIVSLAFSAEVDGLIDSGIIAFTDVDASDTHSAAVTDVVATGDTNGIGNATLLGFLSLGAVTSSALGSAGSVAWSFEADDALFEYLGAGEALEIAYTVEIDDNNGGTDSESVSITINGRNDGPVAADDASTTDEDVAVNIDVLANDTDPDLNDTLTVTSAVANNGTVVIEADGSLTYTGNADFNGTDTISYVVSDGELTDTAQVAVTVNAVNDAPELTPPVAGAVRFDGNAANHVQVAHDAGLNPDSWTVEAWITTTDTDGQFNRVLTKPVGGQQTYSLVVRDGEAHIRFDDATLGQQFVQAGFVADGQPHHIAGVYDSVADTLTLYVDGVVAGSTSTVGFTPRQGTEELNIGRANDGFSQGFAGDISEVRVWSEARSAAEIAADRDQVLDPGSENALELYMVFSRMFTGFDEGSVQGANTIQDLSGNDRDGQIFGFLQFVAGEAPVDNAIVTEVGQEVRFLDLSVLDVDAAEGTNQIQVVLETTDGIIDTQTFPGFTQIGDRTGQVTLIGDPATLTDSLDFSTFKPNDGFSGTATITVTATDLGNAGAGGPQTTVLTFTVEVIDPNADPVAADDAFTTTESGLLSGNLLTNDSDADGDALIIANVEGNASLTPFTVTSDGGRVGQAIFDALTGDFAFDTADGFESLAEGETDTVNLTYTVADGNGGTDTAAIAITVTGDNDAPVAADDTATTDEDTSVNIDVLANDSDVDGDALTVTSASAANGTVVIEADNTLTYTPDADFTGIDTISYVIDDGNGGVAGAEVAVTVTPDDIILFTVNADIVDFDTVNGNDVADGNITNALGGDDFVRLPSNGAEAAEAGFGLVTDIFFSAGDGNDTVIGGDLLNIITGGSGDDSLVGGDGGNDLFGSIGSDTLIGGAGAEFSVGGDDADLIFGNGGNDILEGEDGGDTIFGGQGNDNLTGDDGGPVTVDFSGGVFTYATGSNVFFDNGARLVHVADVATNLVSGLQLTVADDGDLSVLNSGDLLSFSFTDENGDTVSVTDAVIGQSAFAANADEGVLTAVGTAAGGRADGGQIALLIAMDAPFGSGGVPAGGQFIADDADADADFGLPTTVELTALSASDTLDGGGGDDTLEGGADGDDLSGGEGNDLISGGSGDDTLDGGNGSDTLNGGDGTDFITAGAGNDLIIGSEGLDQVLGETGNDRIDYSGLGSAIVASLNTGLVSGVSFFQNLFDIEEIVGTQFDDDLEGHIIFANVIAPGAGNDTVTGNGTNDTVDYSTESGGVFVDLANNLAIDGSGGTDQIFNFTNAIGGQGDDTFRGTAGNNSLDGGEGLDELDFAGETALVTVDLSAGTASGTSIGADTVTNFEAVVGTAFNDTLTGGAEDNDFFGGAGDDSVQGGAGADTISGGAGIDSIFGGDGDDIISGGIGNDILFGGSGFDTVDYSAAGSGINANFQSGVVADGDGGSDGVNSIEAVIGSGFDDQINTGDDTTTVFAGGGNDLITNSAFVFGVTVSGGTGNDTMSGTLGADRFVFQTGDGVDQVNAFQASGGLQDILDFSGDAAITGIGDLSINDDGLGNTIIGYGAGDSITLLGVNSGDLGADDFQF